MLGLALGGLGCESDRVRPGPPAVSITVNQPEADPTDTVRVSVEASSPDGIDSVFVVLDGESLRVDGQLNTYVRFDARWDLESRFPPGDSIYFVAIARDTRAFSARDSALLRIRQTP